MMSNPRFMDSSCVDRGCAAWPLGRRRRWARWLEARGGRPTTAPKRTRERSRYGQGGRDRPGHDQLGRRRGAGGTGGGGRGGASRDTNTHRAGDGAGGRGVFFAYPKGKLFFFAAGLPKR